MSSAREKIKRFIRQRRWRRIVEDRVLRPRLFLHHRPTLITEFNQGPVVVIAPHMDDETIGCGGTLLKHRAAGVPVTVLYLTDGSRGNPDFRPDAALTAARKEETRLAAELLGGADLVFLDYPDSQLKADAATIENLAGYFLRLKPAVVYFPSMFDTHPDHIAACQATSDALARVEKQLPVSPLCREYEVWSPLTPNRVVDITDVFEQKLRALAEFKSQLGQVDYVHVARGLSMYRSIHQLKGRGAAEAFSEFTVATHQAALASLKGVL